MSAQRVRVLVVGLGTMGTSHARAYKAIDDFELVGLCTRHAASRADLEAEFPGAPRFETLDEAPRRDPSRRRRRSAPTPSITPRWRSQALAAGAHVFCEKPLADTLEAAETHRRGGARGAQDAADRLYPARASVLDALRRDRPDARQAAGDAHEPQPAVGGLVLAGAQESDALDLADRRLRRPLCRHHVPGDARATRRRARGRRPAHRRDRAVDVQLRPPRTSLSTTGRSAGTRPAGGR